MTTDIRERVAEVIEDCIRENWESWDNRVQEACAVADALLEAFPQLAEEPEWEYQIGIPDTDWNGFDNYKQLEEARKELESGDYEEYERIIRRRKAGEWEEVK